METSSLSLLTFFSDRFPLSWGHHLSPFSLSVDHGRSTRKRIIHLSPALGPRACRRRRRPSESGRLLGRRAQPYRTGGPRDAARADCRGDQRTRAAVRHRCGKCGAESRVRRSGGPRGQRLPPGPVPSDRYQYADGRVRGLGREPPALRVGSYRGFGQGGRREQSGHTYQPVSDGPG